jgi:hypothetical protein
MQERPFLNPDWFSSKIAYKIMAVPVRLYGSETWTPRKRDWNRIQAAEMKYLRTVKGCTRLDQ